MLISGAKGQIEEIKQSCENLIKHYENIIDRLIFSNMVHGESHPWDLQVNFGVYRLTFNGSSKSTLRDACDYFKREIKKIMPFKMGDGVCGERMEQNESD